MLKTLLVLFDRETGKVATGRPLMSYAVDEDKVADFKQKFDNTDREWRPFGSVFQYDGPFD